MIVSDACSCHKEKSTSRIDPWIKTSLESWKFYTQESVPVQISDTYQLYYIYLGIDIVTELSSILLWQPVLWIRIDFNFSNFSINSTVQEKIYIFLLKIAIYLRVSLGLDKGRPSYRRSLHPSETTSSTSKLEISSLLWVIFALLDPDPYSQWKSGSGSIRPKWMRIRIYNRCLLGLN
jgi:hypothetical protein